MAAEMEKFSTFKRNLERRTIGFGHRLDVKHEGLI